MSLEPSAAATGPAPAAPDLSEPPTFGLGAIAQVALPVRDLTRAIAFYRDALGMRFLFETPALAFFDADGVRLMLAAPDAQGAGDDRRSSVIYFAVKDIDHAARALRARGVHLVQEPHVVARLPQHDVWMAFLEDGEGNTLAITSEVRRRE